MIKILFILSLNVIYTNYDDDKECSLSFPDSNQQHRSKNEAHLKNPQKNQSLICTAFEFDHKILNSRSKCDNKQNYRPLNQKNKIFSEKFTVEDCVLLSLILQGYSRYSDEGKIIMSEILKKTENEIENEHKLFLKRKSEFQKKKAQNEEDQIKYEEEEKRRIEREEKGKQTRKKHEKQHEEKMKEVKLSFEEKLPEKMKKSIKRDREDVEIEKANAEAKESLKRADERAAREIEIKNLTENPKIKEDDDREKRFKENPESLVGGLETNQSVMKGKDQEKQEERKQEILEIKTDNEDFLGAENEIEDENDRKDKKAAELAEKILKEKGEKGFLHESKRNEAEVNSKTIKGNSLNRDYTCSKIEDNYLNNGTESDKLEALTENNPRIYKTSNEKQGKFSKNTQDSFKTTMLDDSEFSTPRSFEKNSSLKSSSNGRFLKSDKKNSLERFCEPERRNWPEIVLRKEKNENLLLNSKSEAFTAEKKDISKISKNDVDKEYKFLKYVFPACLIVLGAFLAYKFLSL